jgi:tetratricopeptide (TPR) repeat protein
LIRRNKLAFSAAASVVAALIIGLGISTWMFVKERKTLSRAVSAEQAAKAERDSAEDVLEFFRDNILSAGRPEGQAGGLGRDVSLRQAIDTAEAKISISFTNRPLVEAAIRKTIGESYRYLGESKLAVQQLERALTLRRQLLGNDNPHTLGTMDLLWFAYDDAGKFDELISLSEERLKLMKAKFGPENLETLAVMNDLALAYDKAGKSHNALTLPLYEETLKLMKARLGPENPETLTTMRNLAQAYAHAGKLDQAIPLGEEALQLAKAKFGPEGFPAVQSMEALATVYRNAGKLDQAISLLEETVHLMKTHSPPAHPETLQRMNNLALLYHDAGKLDQAVALNEETFNLLKTKLGPDHPTTLITMKNLAAAYESAGKSDQAISFYEEAFKLAKAKPGRRGWTLFIANELSNVLATHNKLVEAEDVIRQGLAMERQAPGSGHKDSPLWLWRLGSLLYRQGKLSEAESTFSEGLNLQHATSKNEQSPETPALGLLLRDLADVLREQKNLDDARLLAEKAVAVYQRHSDWKNPSEAARADSVLRQILSDRSDFEQLDALLPRHVQFMLAQLPSNDPRFAGELSMLALDLLRREKFVEAEPLARESLAVREKIAPDDWRTFNSRSLLGGSLLGQKKYSEAELLLLSGYDGMMQHEEKIPPIGRPRLKETLQRLEQLYEAIGRPEDAARWKQKLAEFEQKEEQRRTAIAHEAQSRNLSSKTNHSSK